MKQGQSSTPVIGIIIPTRISAVVNDCPCFSTFYTMIPIDCKITIICTKYYTGSLKFKVWALKCHQKPAQYLLCDSKAVLMRHSQT